MTAPPTSTAVSGGLVPAAGAPSSRATRVPRPARPGVPGGRPPLAATLRNRAGLAIDLLENGALFAIRHGDVLVNQVLGSPIEGGIGNVYLRSRARGGVASFPLLGPGSGSRFRTGPGSATWEGSVEGLDYACTLRLAPRTPTWFWTIRVTNATGRRLSLDAVLAQDLGIAARAAVRSSELYTSQYIDHTVLEDAALGYLVCSRQNLPQAGAIPWVMHGCLGGAAGYLTDGFQFYGLESKATGVPAALLRRRMPNRVRQYEFAMPALQSRTFEVPRGATREVTFFAAFQADHQAATGDDDIATARASAETFSAFAETGVGPPRQRGPSPAAGLFAPPVLFDSTELGREDLERSFGSTWRHVERRDGTLLSFFHGDRHHVVLKAKELVSERPTGHVMRSGRDLLPSDDILSTTAWMYGVFSSQVTIGSTSFNKLLSVTRNSLNVLKASGQRIFVRTANGYELLGVPSAFEMTPNGARWFYQDDDRAFTIRVTTSLGGPACRLDVEVTRGGPIELILTHDAILGENEYEAAGRVVADAARGRIELRPSPETLMGSRYPDATFFIVSPDADRIAEIGGDALVMADGVARGSPLVVVKTDPVLRFSLVLTGSVEDARRARDLADADGRAPDPAADDGFEADGLDSILGWQATLGGAKGAVADDLARLNDVVPWYLHDALIHYTVPHGIEQSSAAAWGLRDVCQGPTELLVATANTAELRTVLATVYGHQERATGDWPQWFMFDRFRDITAPDSHADIIHWPIKALCDYIEATGDVAILDEPVPYADDATTDGPAGPEPISAHVERQVARIERDCILGTSLPVFAGGDWEDTLQPADPAMARRLVSPWTVELAYQTLGRYRTVCIRAGLSAMAERLATLCARLRADFNRYLVPGGVVAGLAEFGPDRMDYFLHPRDRRTGVRYRLLPMTRGMISGMFTAEQAAQHAALIERHLRFPDGVRLMNRPMAYHGGTMRHFQRAESAANFGREVGLQYVHAHIRYVEAMARMGRPEEAWWGLMVICPIRTDLDVPAALPRQSNAYSSSSDAAFMDRREASRGFGRIRSGRVGIMGGWRVYSSGPGIFLNQLVSNVLGLRRLFDDVVFDPVLPARADGLTLDLGDHGCRIRYRFHVTQAGSSPREVCVNGRPMAAGRYADNPYRQGGLLVARSSFDAALDRTENLVEIFG